MCASVLSYGKQAGALIRLTEADGWKMRRYHPSDNFSFSLLRPDLWRTGIIMRIKNKGEKNTNENFTWIHFGRYLGEMVFSAS